MYSWFKLRNNVDNLKRIIDSYFENNNRHAMSQAYSTKAYYSLTA